VCDNTFHVETLMHYMHVCARVCVCVCEPDFKKTSKKRIESFTQCVKQISSKLRKVNMLYQFINERKNSWYTHTIVFVYLLYVCIIITEKLQKHKDHSNRAPAHYNYIGCVNCQCILQI